MTRLLVSSSPHIRQPDSVSRIMWSVVAALSPALIASGSFFGWRAFYVTGISVLTAVLCEAAVQKFLRKIPVTVSDGSAVVTGILVAFCLPPTAPWYVPAVGSAAAILIAKQAFGGLGHNIWNPALIGRAVVHWAYSADMNPSSYPMVRLADPSDGFLGRMGDFFRRFTVDVCAGSGSSDVVTSASPLRALKNIADGVDLNQMPVNVSSVNDYLQRTFEHGDRAFSSGTSLMDAFLGYLGGNIGEVSALLLLIGGIYLMVRGYVRWYVPAVYILTVAVLVAVLPIHVVGGDGQSSMVWAAAFRHNHDIALTWSGGNDLGSILPTVDLGTFWRYVGYHLLCGGLMLGALFMATDMVTSPLTRKGLVIFAVGCGTLTALIRLYGAYPEGVCYSILIMNTVVPLIDRWTKPRVFGAVKPKKEPKAA